MEIKQEVHADFLFLEKYVSLMFRGIKLFQVNYYFHVKVSFLVDD